jgi:hypothetical protein
MMATLHGWEMWVDFARVYGGLSYGDLEDAAPDVAVAPGRYLVVGMVESEEDDRWTGRPSLHLLRSRTRKASVGRMMLPGF